MKNQEKTQDTQEPQEKHQGKLKRIFQRKDWTTQNCPREFFKKYLWTLDFKPQHEES